MNKEINVRHDDILWRFYCKRFSIEGKEVEVPKNLCRYFWTAVKGFGLWLGREVRLRNLWLTSLIATAVIWGLDRLFPHPTGVLIKIPLISVAVLWNFAFLTAMLVSMYRVRRIIEARAPWIIYLLVSCVIVLTIVQAATRGTLWPELTRLFGDAFHWIGYLLIGMVVVIVIGLILSIILRTISHQRLEKLQRALETFSAFVSAKKSGVCPPVNPPEDFKTKS